MKKRQLHFGSWLALAALTTLCLLGTHASGLAMPGQDSKPVLDNDANHQEIMRFHQFLDSHPEIAEQVRKDPSLVDHDEFVRNHPALRDYLRDHPAVREAVRRDPNASMRNDDRSDRDRGERADFDRFLDSHREIADQVRKDPSLVDHDEYVKNHPALLDYLRDHPGVREAIRQDPNAFMRNDDRFDRGRADMTEFDRFLDSHREIAEQVRRDPSLVDHDEFVKDHPALLDYLRDHPAVREAIRRDPNAFREQEARYDQRENGWDRDPSRARYEGIGKFLGSHSDVAQQLGNDPSLLKNQEYLENHPELQAYLNAHPDERQDLVQNPDHVVKAAQPFMNTTNPNGGAKSPTAEPKPKP